jgi:uncharacterized membrane protein
MIYRMGAGMLSLIGLFISAYLYLYKIGRIGSLVCGTGECETVQASAWSRFAGVEVALIGVIGYGALVLLSLAALQPGLSRRRWPADLLAGLSGLGMLFSLYLTYLELFVIHAICRWCVGSAVIISSVFCLALLARRERGPAGSSFAEAG